MPSKVSILAAVVIMYFIGKVNSLTGQSLAYARVNNITEEPVNPTAMVLNLCNPQHMLWCPCLGLVCLGMVVGWSGL